jgi:hypothetical protein
MTRLPWIPVVGSFHCLANPTLENFAVAVEAIKTATITAVLLCVVATTLNFYGATCAVAHFLSKLTQPATFYGGNTSTLRIMLFLRIGCTWLAGSLPMQRVLSLAPGAAAALIPTVPPKELGYDDRQRLVWHYIRPWIPCPMGLTALIYLVALNMRTMPASGSRYPKMTANSAIAAAFVWLVARTSEQESGESWEPITLTLFVSLWAAFMGDSIRSLRSKVDYNSYIVRGGGAACVPITFLFGPSSWAEYWHQYANAGPLVLIATSILVYRCWLSRPQHRSDSDSSEVQAQVRELAERGEFLGAQERVQRVAGRPRLENVHDLADFQLVTPSPYPDRHKD